MTSDNRGLMIEPHLTIWRSNRPRLVDSLYGNISDITDRLLAEGVIMYEHQRRISRILRDNTQTDPKMAAARELTILLENCGVFTLPKVVNCLQKMGFGTLCEHLESSMHAGNRQEKVQAGAMNPDHARIWDKMKPELVANFHGHLRSIIDTLVSHGIISSADEASITNADTRLKLDEPMAGANELVDILRRRGENVLPRLVPILEELTFGELALRLHTEVDKTSLMNPTDLQIWRNNEEYLINKMEPDLPRFLRLFLEADIINDRDKITIEAYERSEISSTGSEISPTGSEQLVELLTRRGQHVLGRIKRALIDGGFADIVEHLEGAILENLPNVPVEETSQLPG